MRGKNGWLLAGHSYLQLPSSFVRFPPLHFGSCLCCQVAHLIAKEILRPITDVAVFINLELFISLPSLSRKNRIGLICSNPFIANLVFGNPAH